MAVSIDLGGDPSFDLDIQGQSNLHGRVEWKPSTNEYRVVTPNGSVPINGTQTRPKNRSLSNIGLDDPESASYGQIQCLWDNAAFEPAIERIAPASFIGNAVASWRLFDDSDRCWWIVVESSGSELIVWLHRPATIFLQKMQPLPDNCRELHRFSIPSHLVGEPVTVTFPPRGNKAVLQIITDKSEVPLDQPAGFKRFLNADDGRGDTTIVETVFIDAAPERYTVSWAQFIRVLDFSGAGSWPEVSDSSDWGEGIHCTEAAYQSGSGSLSVKRFIREPYWACTQVSKLGGETGPWGDEPHLYYDYDISATCQPFLIDRWRPRDPDQVDALGNKWVASPDGTGALGPGYVYGYRLENINAPLMVCFDGSEMCEYTVSVDIDDTSDLSASGTIVFGGRGSFEGDIWHGNHGGTTHDSRSMKYVRNARWSVEIAFKGRRCFSLDFTENVSTVEKNRISQCVVNGDVLYSSDDYDYRRQHYQPFIYLSADVRGVAVSANMGAFRPDGDYYALLRQIYRKMDHIFVGALDGAELILPDELPGWSVYSAVDWLGRRYDDIPDWWWSYVEHQSRQYTHSDVFMVLSYLKHPGGGSSFQYGRQKFYEEYARWLTIGYC